jgi:hypothetical protein
MRAFATAAPELALAYQLLMFAVLIVFLGWSTACWGALRHLHAVARWRSALAGLASLAAAVIFFSGMNYVLLGMFGTHVPPLR